MRIEICGNIASGKTTLANLFRKNMNVLLEEYEANPFWAAFYSNPQKFQFETEIAFLLQHYHLIKRDYEDDEVNVCDYSFLLDYSYALSDLEVRELEIFGDIFKKIINELGSPNILIYLKCDLDIILNRIKKRGREEEESIDIDFLKLIDENIKKSLNSSYYENKLIEIDSGKIDFAHETDTKSQIFQRILNEVESVKQ